MVLDTIVCMFSQYCKDTFTCEQCEVVTPDGDVRIYPDIKNRQERVSAKQVNSKVGIDQSADTLANSLTRMCLSATADNDDILVNFSFSNQTRE